MTRTIILCLLLASCATPQSGDMGDGNALAIGKIVKEHRQ